MDKSDTRRGQPCWYRHENVGLVAINDACVLKSLITVVLKTRFREHKAYLDIVELFSEASVRTGLGQHCDLMASEGLLKWNKSTCDNYEFITINKTAYNTCYAPIMISLLYLGLDNAETKERLYELSMTFGLLFQARDDFVDVYGDPLLTGKVGTDIQEHKCTWLSVMALEHCKADQRSVLENCYGSQETDDVCKVREVYDQLNMANLFEQWDEEMSSKLDDAIRDVKMEY
jgi:farnesyl diphosphate synthase